MLALLLLAPIAFAPQEPRAPAAERAPGRVVLVGADASIDAATAAELGGQERLLLAPGDPAQAVDPLAAAGGTARRIGIDGTKRFVGDERPTAEVIRSARCIVLSGGGYLDWFRLVTPGGTTTRLSDSIRAAHRGGATVVGVGAAAPYLAQWAMIERSAIDHPERNPRRHREEIAIEGLGLVRDLLVDTSARERGDPGRMLRAAFDGHVEAALYLDGPTVWIDDPAHASARVAGPGRTIFFDLDAARRLRGTWRDGRIAVLEDGDRWSRHGGIECAAGRARDEAGPAIEGLLRSIEAAGGKLAIGGRDRDVPCRLAFDLEWEPSGS